MSNSHQHFESTDDSPYNDNVVAALLKNDSEDDCVSWVYCRYCQTTGRDLTVGEPPSESDTNKLKEVMDEEPQGLREKGFKDNCEDTIHI